MRASLRHVGQHRRLEEIALVADALAAGRDLGALGHRVGDEPLHGVDPAAVAERPHAGVSVKPVADLDGFARSTNCSTNSS